MLYLVNLLLEGAVPSSHPLRESTIVALDKGGGKVRPIAIGESSIRGCGTDQNLDLANSSSATGECPVSFPPQYKILVLLKTNFSKNVVGILDVSPSALSYIKPYQSFLTILVLEALEEFPSGDLDVPHSTLSYIKP